MLSLYRALSCLIIFELIMGPVAGPLAHAGDDDFDSARVFLNERIFNRLPADPEQAQTELQRRRMEFEAYYRKSADVETGQEEVDSAKAEVLYRALGMRLAPLLHHPERLRHLRVQQNQGYRVREAPTTLTGEQSQTQVVETLDIAQEQGEQIRRNRAHPQDGILKRFKRRSMMMLLTAGFLSGLSFFAVEMSQTAFFHHTYGLGGTQAATSVDSEPLKSAEPVRADMLNNFVALHGAALRDGIHPLFGSHYGPINTLTNSDLNKTAREILRTRPIIGRLTIIDADEVIGHFNTYDELPGVLALSQAARSENIEGQSWMQQVESSYLQSMVEYHVNDFRMISRILTTYRIRNSYSAEYVEISEAEMVQLQQAIDRINIGLVSWYIAHLNAPKEATVQTHMEILGLQGAALGAFWLMLTLGGYALDRKKGSALRRKLLDALAQGYQAGCQEAQIPQDLGIFKALRSGSLLSVATAIPANACEAALGAPRVRVADVASEVKQEEIDYVEASSEAMHSRTMQN